jgi:hypothetical protein
MFKVRRSYSSFLMSLDIPSIQQIDGSGLRFAIIASRYNEALVDSLVQHASATLTAAGAEAASLVPPNSPLQPRQSRTTLNSTPSS